MVVTLELLGNRGEPIGELQVQLLSSLLSLNQAPHLAESLNLPLYSCPIAKIRSEVPSLQELMPDGLTWS